MGETVIALLAGYVVGIISTSIAINVGKRIHAREHSLTPSEEEQFDANNYPYAPENP